MIALVLGGARSGKSVVAERLVGSLSTSVTYLATAGFDTVDREFAARIEQHRQRRPATWSTVEAGSDLANQLALTEGVVLVDSLGTWVAAHDDFAVDVDALVDALARRQSDTVLVSEEVGLGVHPSTQLGGHFRDTLGLINQRMADIADRVVLVVAGRILPLERSPW